MQTLWQRTYLFTHIHLPAQTLWFSTYLFPSSSMAGLCTPSCMANLGLPTDTNWGGGLSVRSSTLLAGEEPIPPQIHRPSHLHFKLGNLYGFDLFLGTHKVCGDHKCQVYFKNNQATTLNGRISNGQKLTFGARPPHSRIQAGLALPQASPLSHQNLHRTISTQSCKAENPTAMLSAVLAIPGL